MADSEDGKRQGQRSARAKRPRSPHYKGNNEGGYGNPPVDGQFKGKPGPGRPKGSISFDSTMKKALEGQVPLKGGGSVHYKEALATAAIEASLKKTPSSTEFGFKLINHFGLDKDEVELDISRLTEAEMCVAMFTSTKMQGIPFPTWRVAEILGDYRIYLNSNGQPALCRINHSDKIDDF